MGLHGLSKDLYELINMTANVWEVAINKKDWTTEINQLHQVKGEFKPISPLVGEYKQALQKVFGSKIPTLTWPTYKNGPLLAQISLADTHFWRVEEKNHSKYLQSIQDRTLQLFELLLKSKPDKLLLCQLWDFFNSESNGYTTSGKNAQHNSIDAKTMFANGLRFHLELIKTLASELPTDVFIIWWNHDRNILSQMWEAVDLYFANTPNVAIDNSDKPRKYYKWWSTNLWFSHGDWEREKEILKVFANENWLWKYNYHTRWHFHERSVQQYGPVEVDTIASTAVQSDWERNKFSDKKWKLIGKLYDKTAWKIKEHYN